MKYTKKTALSASLILGLFLLLSCGRTAEQTLPEALPRSPAQAQAESPHPAAQPEGTEAPTPPQNGEAAALPIDAHLPQPPEMPTLRVGMEGFIAADDAVGAVLSETLGVKVIPVNIRADDIAHLATLAAANDLPDLLRINLTLPLTADWLARGLLQPWPLQPRLPQPEPPAGDAGAVGDTAEGGAADGSPADGGQDDNTEDDGAADGDMAGGNPEYAPPANNAPAGAATGGTTSGTTSGYRPPFSAAQKAFARLYGGQNWFLPLQNIPDADSGRIYYRADWLAELGLDPPQTAADFYAMLEAFVKHKDAPLALAGGVTYLIAMFGTDPHSWILEDGAWVPAYYSETMLEGLTYVRSLYENKLLDFDYAITKANAAVQKLAEGKAGALIRHGDAVWMTRVLTAFSEAGGVPRAVLPALYLGIMPPFGPNPAWAPYVETEGLVLPASTPATQMGYIEKLLAYIASPESEDLAYFGIPGETCARDAAGRLRLFIDPSTAQPFNITERYPAARVLFLLGRGLFGEHDFNIPALLPPSAKQWRDDADALYGQAAIDEGDGHLIHYLHTPAKEALAETVDFAAAFNTIVMGHAPVEEMFAAFRAECEEKNIRAAIEEVTARMETAAG